MRCFHHICTLTIFASSSDVSLKVSGDNFVVVVANLLNFIRLTAFNMKVLAACQSCYATVTR